MEGGLQGAGPGGAARCALRPLPCLAVMAALWFSLAAPGHVRAGSASEAPAEGIRGDRGSLEHWGDPVPCSYRQPSFRALWWAPAQQGDHVRRAVGGRQGLWVSPLALPCLFLLGVCGPPPAHPAQAPLRFLVISLVLPCGPPPISGSPHLKRGSSGTARGRGGARPSAQIPGAGTFHVSCCLVQK